jgi:hypothetical protein
VDARPHILIGRHPAPPPPRPPARLYRVPDGAEGRAGAAGGNGGRQRLAGGLDELPGVRCGLPLRGRRQGGGAMRRPRASVTRRAGATPRGAPVRVGEGAGPGAGRVLPPDRAGAAGAARSPYAHIYGPRWT